jgi:hypothetical protein
MRSAGFAVPKGPKSYDEGHSQRSAQSPESISGQKMQHQTPTSPLTMMTGTLLSPDCNNFKIESGACARVFEDNNPTNTNQTRSTGAIALTQTDDAQGGCHFMSLTTGRKALRQQWRQLLIPNRVTAAVEAMATTENHPFIMGNGGPCKAEMQSATEQL